MTILVKVVDELQEENRGAEPSEPPDMASAIGAAHRALTAALIRELARRGFADLSPAYAAILPLIELSGSRQVALAQRAGLTKQAVGQLVQELTARGYVELAADPLDGRARVVRFTPRGLALRQAGLEVKRELWVVVAAAIGGKVATELAKDLLTMAGTLAPPSPTDAG